MQWRALNVICLYLLWRNKALIRENYLCFFPQWKAMTEKAPMVSEFCKSSLSDVLNSFVLVCKTQFHSWLVLVSTHQKTDEPCTWGKGAQTTRWDFNIQTLLWMGQQPSPRRSCKSNLNLLRSCHYSLLFPLRLDLENCCKTWYGVRDDGKWCQPDSSAQSSLQNQHCSFQNKS